MRPNQQEKVCVCVSIGRKKEESLMRRKECVSVCLCVGIQSAEKNLTFSQSASGPVTYVQQQAAWGGLLKVRVHINKQCREKQMQLNLPIPAEYHTQNPKAQNKIHRDCINNRFFNDPPHKTSYWILHYDLIGWQFCVPSWHVLYTQSD